MKTKAHLIVTLVDAGLPEKRAIYLAGMAFGKDKDARKELQEHYDALHATHKLNEAELHAVHTALHENTVTPHAAAT